MTQNAGELRHRIMVQHFTSGRDEDGYPIPEQWVDYMPLWAKVTHLSGKDLIAAQASNSKIVARLKIRYREDIDTTMRVVYDNKIYSITGEPMPDAENGKIYMTIMLSAGIEK